jgi:hypothetical protein
MQTIAAEKFMPAAVLESQNAGFKSRPAQDPEDSCA